MEFEQVAPRRAVAADGSVVELVDRHHAQLHGPEGMWMVELGPEQEDDWFTITVFRDSLLRAGGDPMPGAEEHALERIIAGLRSLRVRVHVGAALTASDEVATDQQDPVRDAAADDRPAHDVPAHDRPAHGRPANDDGAHP